MATLVTDIPQLKFNKMSKEKYEELLTNGELVENEFYITPENEEDISDKADITYVDEQIALKADKETTYTKEEVNSLVQNVEVDAYTKEEVDNLLENIDALPEQTDNSGKLLSTDGENALWIDAPSSLPTMDETTSGKFLTNNNGNAEWIENPDINTNGWNIFDHKFSDHLLNDPSWVRSDTYSWQDGGIYFTAYEELEKENSGRVDNIEVIKYYAWQIKQPDGGGNISVPPLMDVNAGTLYTLVATPTDTDNVYARSNETTELTTSENVLFTSFENELMTVSINGSSYTYERYLDGDVKEIEPGNASSDTIGDVTITYYKSVNGLKICLPDQSDAIEQLYDNTGVAWYYIIDTENKRFKLPRSKWNFVGSRGNVGDYVDETLPNITGNTEESTGTYLQSDGNSSQNAGNGALFYKEVGTATSNSGTGGKFVTVGFDASRSSSAYQDNAPVQQRATEMYLYFFMGDTLRDARIIDVNAAIENQTNVTNELDALKNLLATIDYVVESKVATDDDPTWYRVYKSGWVEQGGNEYKSHSVNSGIYTISYTLPKEMKDNNYTAFASAAFNGGESWNGPSSDKDKCTSTTVVFEGWATGSSTIMIKNWQVSGQGAQ